MTLDFLVNDGIARRFISTPIKANGAQQLTAQGIPQVATSSVADRTERAAGANSIVKANIMCESIHAVCRSGRVKWNLLRNLIRPKGERRMEGCLVSGETTPKGRITELMNVTKENITRDMLPRRPTSPNVSGDFSAASLGAS